MTLHQLLYFAGKVIMAGSAAGFRLTQAALARRAHRRSSFIRRTRFAGLFLRVRQVARVVLVAAVLIVLLLVVLTSCR